MSESGSYDLHASHRTVAAEIQRLAAQAARGGDRYIGRRLWRMLVAAGFNHRDSEILSGHSDDIGTQRLRPTTTSPWSSQPR